MSTYQAAGRARTTETHQNRWKRALAEIAGYFRPSNPVTGELPLQQRIYLVVFLAISALSVSILPYYIQTDYQQGDWVSIIMLGLYSLLLIIGLMVFLTTRIVRYTRLIQSGAMIILATYLILDAGGLFGITVLFIIIGFPLLYYVMGVRGGMLFTTLYLTGLLLRIRLGPLPDTSVFAHEDLRPMAVQLLFAGWIFGNLALILQHVLIHDLVRMAYYDQLTQLPARRSMDEYIRNTIRADQPFHLVAVKVYNFSQLTSHQGSRIGDKVITCCADRLRSMVPDGTMIARWSGTVLIACHEGFDTLTIRDWAHDLLDTMQEPIELGEAMVNLRAGIAITRYPDDGQNRDRLIANLMSTLDRPELMIGKLRFFNEAAWNSEQRRFKLANAMKGALDRQEFSIRYHPKIEFLSGECSGAEVLLRWNNPELGDIPPSEFIPVAETTGLIRELTRFVFKRFFEEMDQIHELLDSVSPVYAHAINISPLDLYSLDLPGFIKSELLSRKLDPAILELEITEGATISDDPQTGLVLQELKFIGCSLAIDDFGTGYSSLSYLHKLEADNLKIDQSFIRTLGPGKELDPVVDAVILMAHSLGMKVTAEGVETEYQARYLKDKGCDYAQGYLYSEPLTLADYKLWLEGCSCHCV